jgi:hypothetical protein
MSHFEVLSGSSPENTSFQNGMNRRYFVAICSFLATNALKSSAADNPKSFRLISEILFWGIREGDPVHTKPRMKAARTQKKGSPKAPLFVVPLIVETRR